MAQYLTKQRALFVDYLKEHPDSSFTAKQLYEAVGGMSLSAVYRNLSLLEKEGSVRKRDIYYEYTGSQKCKSCLHMSCKRCGKTLHMSTFCSEFIINNILSSERFFVDRGDTVLYGLCDSCR